MPAAERRADIARAAREVFVERGPAGARTKEIAERAGITEAFVFRVWAGKEEPYREAIEEPAHQLMARMERDILDALRSGSDDGTGGVATLRTLIEPPAGLTPFLPIGGSFDTFGAIGADGLRVAKM